MKNIMKQTKLISIIALTGVLGGCGTAASIISESREDQEFFVVSGVKYKAGNAKWNIYQSLTSAKGSNCTDYGSDSIYILSSSGFSSSKLFECNPKSSTAKKSVDQVLKEYGVVKMPADKG